MEYLFYNAIFQYPFFLPCYEIFYNGLDLFREIDLENVRYWPVVHIFTTITFNFYFNA